MKDRIKKLIRETSDENNEKLAASDNADVARAAEHELAKREEHDRRQEDNDGR